MNFRIMQFSKILVASACFAFCNSHQTTKIVNAPATCNELEAGQTGFLQLTSPEEPGELLTVYGKVVDQLKGTAVPGASIFFYQTDSSGIYNPNGGPDREARIKGTVLTNESGCFKIKTILPGDYPGQKNSRHLHYILTAEGFKETKSILFFKGFTTSNLSNSETLAVLDIWKDDAGGWIGSMDLKIIRSDD